MTLNPESTLISHTVRHGTYIVTVGGYELRAEVRKPDTVWLLSPEGRIETTRLEQRVHSPEDVIFRVSNELSFPPPVTRCLALEYGRALLGQRHGR